MSWENLIKDQGIFCLVIILLILITLYHDNAYILLGENWCLSLVYTETVDSVFRALWLATQSVNILHYSLIHLQFLRASDAKLA